MYAIVDIAGQQLKVQRKRWVYVNRLQQDEGEKVQFNAVMLLDNGTDVKVGIPTIDGASVSGTVLEHLKGDKVIVFKKKRRKGYQKKNGHRQYLTKLMIDDIAAEDFEIPPIEEDESVVDEEDALIEENDLLEEETDEVETEEEVDEIENEEEENTIEEGKEKAED